MPNSHHTRHESPVERRRRLHRQRILRNRFLFGAACLLLVLGVASLFRTTVDEPPAVPAVPPAEAAAQVNTHDERLILVNNNLPLPEGYAVETEVADDNTGKELQKDAAQAYRQMTEAARAEDVELMLCSGYRTVEYQQELFDKKKQKYLDKGDSEEEAFEKARTVVALPGCSEHNTGLAADIVTPDHQDLDTAFERTDAFKWMDAHAAEYGFILRYPEDKQAITGIIYEPWHYRYVGAENAAAMKASGLCLEEVYGLAG